MSGEWLGRVAIMIPLLLLGITILVLIILHLARVNRDLWNLVDDLDEE